MGVLLGEIVHRVVIFIQELMHNRPRHKKVFKKSLKAAFYIKHSQPVIVLFLFCLAVCLALNFGHLNFFSLDFSQKMFPLVVVWACLRKVGAFENSIEDMEILEESNAELGHGLAANYWFSFLIIAVKSDIKQKMEEHQISVQRQNYRSFKKLIIFLPDDCHLQIGDEEQLKSENIWRCTELCDGSFDCKNSHNLQLGLKPGEKKTQTVNWIYEDPKYEKVEEENNKLKANKIFVIFDFPQLIKSAMGPERGWEENERPGARKRNINSFKKTVKNFVKCNNTIRYEKDLLFLEFPNREPQNEKHRKLLSAIIREKILEEEEKEHRAYSSSSC